MTRAVIWHLGSAIEFEGDGRPFPAMCKSTSVRQTQKRFGDRRPDPVVGADQRNAPGRFSEQQHRFSLTTH